MRIRDAAEIIGCHIDHLRRVVAQGKIKSTKHKGYHNQHGFEYEISQKEAEKYRDKTFPGGWPRGKKRPIRAKGKK